MIKFVPRQIPNRIFIIGCGGTGSRLVPLLSQFIRTVTQGVTPRGNVINPTIYLIDDDVVEEKNLLRQNFISSDVGKGKAEVLAGRYSRAFGVNIVPIQARITEGGHSVLTNQGLRDVASNSLVIMCVDSAQARRDILTCWGAFDYVSPAASQAAFFIDAGNEDDFGQVRFFNRALSLSANRLGTIAESIPKLTPEVAEIDCLPIDVQFYRELQDNPGGSCADLDQTLAINALMATMIMGVVQNLYYVKPFTYYSMGISLTSGPTISPITPQYLASVSDVRWSGVRFSHTTDLLPTFRKYARDNVRKLKSMGLDTDGTPLASGPVNAIPKERPSQGDVVQIVRIVTNDDDPDYQARWVEHMDSTLGREGVVTKVDYPGIGFLVEISGEDREWWFSPDSLEILSCTGDKEVPVAEAVPAPTATPAAAPADVTAPVGTLAAQVVTVVTEPPAAVSTQNPPPLRPVRR